MYKLLLILFNMLYVYSIPFSETSNLKFLKSDYARVFLSCMINNDIIQAVFISSYKALNLKVLKRRVIIVACSNHCYII